MVTNTSACPCPDNAATSLCQAGIGYCGVSLSQYSAANSTWYSTIDGSSVMQVVQDGTFCEAEGGDYGGDYREATFVYMCDPTATTAVLVNVSEIHTCFYTAYFLTSAACTTSNSAATGPYGGIGSTWYDTRCGGGAYDLSSLSTSDLFWDANTTSSTDGWQWWLRVCGSVSTVNCTSSAGQGDSSIPSTQTAMLCQSDKTDPSGDDNAASYYIASQQLWSITNTGLMVSIQDGESCGTNFPRETSVNFVCNSSATTAVMTGVIESPACYYTATVQTSLVCGTVSGSSSSTSAVAVSSSSSSTAGATSATTVSSATSSPSSSAATNTASASSTVTPSTATTVASSSSTATTPGTPVSGAASTSASLLIVAALLASMAMML